MFHLQLYSFDRAGALTLLIIFVTNKILQRKTLFNHRTHKTQTNLSSIKMALSIAKKMIFWAPTEAQKLLLFFCQFYSF